MDKLKIINTQPSDLPFIYYLFDEAIAYQKRKGYPVWPDYDKSVLQNDIKINQQYKIIEGEKIACIFSICFEDKIVWRERDNSDAIYLHRIVTNPIFKGQQLFGKILEWSKEYVAAKKIPFIRMDTWADNPPLVNYYQKYGFKIVDYFTTPDSDELPIQQRGNRVVLLEYKLEVN